MLPRNSRHRRDQRHPSMRGFDFFEAQNDASPQPRFDRADMSLDFLSRIDGLTVPCDQRLRQSGMEMIAGLHGFGVNPIRKLDEEYGALRHDVAGNGSRALRDPRRTEQD